MNSGIFLYNTNQKAIIMKDTLCPFKNVAEINTNNGQKKENKTITWGDWGKETVT